MHALTYVELDVDYCALSFGVAPCTAAVGVTGDRKCFNTLSTCQDRPNFTNVPVTLRFAVPTEYLPIGIDAIPSITGISYSPAIISLGEDLGQRAQLSVSFSDHPWPDTGPGGDKYLADRDYDPFRQGSFWGKFRARQPFLQGRPLRLIRGFLGDDIADMEIRNFLVDSFDGPSRDGSYTLTAKDALKLADGPRAQAPALSTGFLVADITAIATSATLSPAGIGNEEYPASGYVAIGGKEIVAFTRAADVLTITRAQFGTTAVAHEDQDRVQLVLYYDGEDPADIIADLLENYAGVPAGYLPTAAWLTETEAFFRRLLTACIAEPTPVKDLVAEIIEQAGLAVWWDDVQQIVRLQVLRAIATDADRFDDELMLAGSFAAREQPDKRLSQVWTYFGQRNPLDRQDDPDNYRSVAATVELEKESDYGAAAIKKIFSRWIPAFGRTIAERLNAILLGRYVDPPRRFTFSLMRPTVAVLGGGYNLGFWTLQDDTGARVDVPVQVTRLKPEPDRIDLEAEEMLFVSYDEEDLDDRVIIIDSDINDFDLRATYDTLYPDPVSGDVVTCVIQAGVTVGSSSAATPAFDVGSWPAGVDITLTVAGRIEGAGGSGGTGAGLVGGVVTAAAAGQAGGTALYTRYAIDLDVSAGEIWGGGGGGGGGAHVAGFGVAYGGGGGGGGAGAVPGIGGAGGAGDTASGNAGSAGTATAAGAGGEDGYNHVDGYGKGGTGGGPGLVGSAGQPHNGTGGPYYGAAGAAGKAIDGISYVTVTAGPGDRRGGEVN